MTNSSMWAGLDEVETILVRVFPRGDLSGDFQGFELSSHSFSDQKPSAKPTEKTTVNALKSCERWRTWGNNILAGHERR
jgi:hypothetical protein